MYKSSKASIIIDCEDKTLLPELEDRPLSSPEEDFTPHICHLCCCPERAGVGTSLDTALGANITEKEEERAGEGGVYGVGSAKSL
uniref:Uncharacterized protein n=1 Tax=Knipowitschia caucasica TaxID=637954 RepID=A0AAV2J3I1_KNICA